MGVIKSVVMPDIGDVTDVEIIETMTQVGDSVVAGQALLTVESDKASMDIPCEVSGVVREFFVAAGDKVQQGDVVARIEVNEELAMRTLHPVQSNNATGTQNRQGSIVTPAHAPLENAPIFQSKIAKAGPSSRRLARKLGVDIFDVEGTGRRGQILKEDVQAHVKAILARQADDASFRSTSSTLPDLSKFGPTHTASLTNIEQVTSRNMQRAWREIPHAWLQQSIDITELEQGRKRLKSEVDSLTITALIVKAISLTLAQFPRFNSVLDVQAQQLIYREYINIGVAIDTPRGLVIAVIRDVDRLSIRAIGSELDRLSTLARVGELPASDMQGAGMTVSSLGGLSIDGLQPIVNWPEVAILGVARACVQAIFCNSQFEPRLILPVTLGFDHRVINGADGAGFLAHIKHLLSDPMRLLIVS